MSTSYTLRSRPSTTYTLRNKQVKWKAYLQGYNDLGEVVYVCDQDGNKIVIYADAGFEKVEYNNWTLRDRI